MSAPITSASVRVLRSHDYCHFEVSLATNGNDGLPLTTADVDLLRKEAARLADKAVEQYKVAKQNAERLIYADPKRINLEASEASTIPEGERTTEQKAAIKALADYNHRAQFDYQDDWPDYYDNDDD